MIDYILYHKNPRFPFQREEAARLLAKFATDATGQKRVL